MAQSSRRAAAWPYRSANPPEQQATPALSASRVPPSSPSILPLRVRKPLVWSRPSSSSRRPSLQPSWPNNPIAPPESENSFVVAFAMDRSKLAELSSLRSLSTRETGWAPSLHRSRCVSPLCRWAATEYKAGGYPGQAVRHHSETGAQCSNGSLSGALQVRPNLRSWGLPPARRLAPQAMVLIIGLAGEGLPGVSPSAQTLGLTQHSPTRDRIHRDSPPAVLTVSGWSHPFRALC